MLEVKTLQNIKEDKDLVDIVLTTDNEREKNNAFAKLLSKYKWNITNNLRRMVKREDVAKDLLFETFEKAYENIESYDKNRQAFSTWLFRIAHNHSIDYLRKRKEIFESLDKDIHNANLDTYKKQIKNNDKNPEEVISISETNAQLHYFISKIKKPEERQALELRYFKGCKYEVIAEIMGIPLNTAKVLIHRAKKELKKLYKVK